MELNHELDDRKKTILQTIIKTYLETGEPVGSRTISKYTDLNLSSATIRNEMADLEDLGYIIQPHTSAGRIPSDKGYRWYVDMLMEEKEQEVTEMREQMLQKADKMDQILKQAAKVLASSTNYATMVSAPTYNRNKLKFIQLSQVDENQIIAVIVMEGNIIKNKIVTVEETLNNETLLKLNMLLNTTLTGMSIEEINLGMIARLKEQAGNHSEVIGDVLDAVATTIQVDNDMEIYTSGATNVFKYPELSDSQSAQEIIRHVSDGVALAEKHSLPEVLVDFVRTHHGTTPAAYFLNQYLNGGGDPEDVSEFLSDIPKKTYDPFLLLNMKAGVDLLLKEIKSGTRICIYGDYDADGVTSVCILSHILSMLTNNFTYYIPSRFDEGYGLNKNAIDKIIADGVGVILTVDCGSVSYEEVEYAKQLGLKVIVTDHHSIDDVKADCILINPKQKECTYPFKELAGCGVAFKLAQAIQKTAGLPKSAINEVLDLVAIGTVGDIVSLTDENRTIVKYGINKINSGNRNSLKTLTNAISIPWINSENIA